MNPPLLPIPRHLELTGGTHLLESGCRIVLDSAHPGSLLFAAQRLQSALANIAAVTWSLAASEAGPASEIGAVLWVDPARVPQTQGYELSITSNTISVIAHDDAGIFYGVCTLIQWLEQHSEPWQSGEKSKARKRAASAAPLAEVPCL